MAALYSVTVQLYEPISQLTTALSLTKLKYGPYPKLTPLFGLFDYFLTVRS